MKWPVYPLKQLADFDPTPPRKQLLEANPRVAFMPMASVVSESSVATTELNRSASEVLTGYTYFQAEDVLVAKITPCFENGKIAIANIPQECGFGTTEFHVIRVKRELLDAKYLTHFLRQPWIIAEGERKMTGSAGQRRVPRHFLEGLEIPAPSIKEQRRIAAILDQAEGLRAKRRQALAKLDNLTQSLFLGLSTKGNPSPLSLKEIVTFKTGKLDSNAAEANGRYPFFTCAKEDAYINTHAFDQEALLLAGNNAAGEYSVKHFKGKFNAYQRTYVISIDESQCTYEYVRYALQSKLSELKYQSKGTGTKYLTLEILNRLKVPLPSIQDQQEFSSRLKELGIQEAAILKSDLQLKQLQSTLEYRAFRGEL